MQQSPHDNCLFVKRSGDNFLCLFVYVDDVLITGPNEQSILELKSVLNKAFTIKDLGVAHYFLGMEIARGDSGIVLNQRKYVLDLLDSTVLSGCFPVSTPLPVGFHLTASGSSPLKEPNIYRRLVGRLLYLNLTRLDVSFAIQHLSQFVSKPAADHLNVALRVVKYLKGNPSLGLFYSSHIDFKIVAYSDADYGACVDSRKSVTGYCIFLGSSLISWRCKKQVIVSASSVDVEYHALGSIVRELQWISYMLHDFGILVALLIPLYCDNMTALHITKNSVFHERTKHLEIDCHIVRNLYLDGFVLPYHVLLFPSWWTFSPRFFPHRSCVGFCPR